MEQKTENQPLYKARGLVACVRNMFTLFRLNWFTTLRNGWIPLVICALGAALCTVLTGVNGQLCALLLSAVGVCLFYGWFYYGIHRYKESGTYAPVRFLSHGRSSLRWTLRFVAVHLPAAVLTLVFLALSWYGIAGTIVWGDKASVPLWAGIVACVLLIYVSVPLTVFCLSFLNGDRKYLPSLLYGFKQGTLRWGNYFAVAFLAGIIYTLCLLILHFPMGITLLVENADYISIQEGNPSGLPAIFYVMKFIVAFLSAGLSLYGSTLVVGSLLMLYTSDEQKAQERADYLRKRQEKTN